MSLDLQQWATIFLLILLVSNWIGMAMIDMTLREILRELRKR